MEPGRNLSFQSSFSQMPNGNKIGKNQEILRRGTMLAKEMLDDWAKEQKSYRKGDVDEIARASIASRRSTLESTRESKRQPSFLLSAETIHSLSKKELVSIKSRQSMVKGSDSSTRKTSHWRKLIRPDSNFRTTWDVATLILLGYVALMTPIRIGFEYDVSGGSPLFYFEILLDLFFICDILVNFRTGFFRPDGGLEMRQGQVAKTYLRGYFLIDFLSSFPIDWIVQSLENFQSAKVLKAGKILKVSRIFKLTKLARLMKLPHLMARVEDGLNISPVQLKLMRILLNTSLIAHINACGWAFVSRVDEEAYYVESWTSHYGMVDAPLSSQYVAAVYWAITTMTTVGYGDILPRTDLERVYCLMSMVFGGAFYAYVIATLSSIVTNQDANQRLISERMDSIMTYMRIRKFPKHLFRRVKEYFKYYYQTKTALNESTILQDLSPALRSEVALFLIDQTVSNNPLFKDMSAKNFARLITILYPIKVEEGEFIFHAGDIGEEMYLLISGTLEVLDAENQVQAVLTSGAYFGELCALGITNHRTCSIRATMLCELYSLSKNDFFETFAKSEPETIMKMVQLAVTTYEDLYLENPDKPMDPSTKKEERAKIERIRSKALLAENAENSKDASLPRRPMPVDVAFNVIQEEEEEREEGLDGDEDDIGSETKTPNNLFITPEASHARSQGESIANFSNPARRQKRPQPIVKNDERVDRLINMMEQVLEMLSSDPKYSKVASQPPKLESAFAKARNDNNERALQGRQKIHRQEASENMLSESLTFQELMRKKERSTAGATSNSHVNRMGTVFFSMMRPTSRVSNDSGNPTKIAPQPAWLQNAGPSTEE